MANQPVTYKDAGVDIDAMNSGVLRIKEHVRSTFTPGVLSDVGSFGGLFALDTKSMQEPVLVASIDGVGTKLKVACMAGAHARVGGDLVNHCINDILVQGARPLFFLDYFAAAKLEPDVLVEVVRGASEACRASGAALLGGETAEMPGLYPPGEYDLAGCIIGVVDRTRIVDGSSIQPGDKLIGLVSDGLHTNGFSLARKVLFDAAGYDINSKPETLADVSIGDALLTQHRCYAKPILALMDEVEVKGMAHLTGGGFTDNIPRILPEGCAVTVDKSTWDVLPIFRLIQEAGSVPEAEMHRTFNMGIGYVVVVDAGSAERAVDILTATGETAKVIGEVHAGSRDVTLA